MNTQDLDVDSRLAATSFVRGLERRGIRLAVRNSRLKFSPADAYGTLTDQEILALRRHRRAIVALVRAGLEDINATTTTEPTKASEAAPAARQEAACPYCKATLAACAEARLTRADAWEIAHYLDPSEMQRRAEVATKIMLRQMPYGHSIW